MPHTKTTPMKKLGQILEIGFVSLYLIFYSGGPLTVILAGGFSEGDEASELPTEFPLIRLLFLLSYVIAFSLLLYRWKHVLYCVSKNKLLLLLVGVAVASVIWSAQPQITQTRVISLIGTTLFGIYFGTRFSLRKQLEILSVIFSIIIGLSILFAIALPKYGIMGGIHAGDWRGIYLHKNVFAQTMTLSSILFLCLLDGTRGCWKRSIGFFLSVVMILLSTSTSALINLINLTITFLVLQTLRLHHKVVVPAVCIVLGCGCVVSVLLIENLELIVGAFGKDLTLTGRADMWPIVAREGLKNALFGFGYSGFWGDSDSPGGIVWRDYGWKAPNAHNGFLDLWIQLGFVGLAVFLVLFFQLLSKGILISRKVERPVYSWTIMYLMFTLFSNLTETSLMINNSLTWILFVSISVSLQTFRSQQKETTEFSTPKISSLSSA